MGDGNTDLTRDNNWNEVTVSMVTNPYHADTNKHIMKRIETLDGIVRDMPNPEKNAEARLRDLFADANRNNDLRTALVYGDRLRKGDGYFTGKLEQLDRHINLRAEEAGRKHKHVREFANLWNELRHQIPEKLDYIQTNYDRAFDIHRGDILNADNDDDRKAAQGRFNKTSAAYRDYKKHTAQSELNRDWEKVALKQSWGQRLIGSLKTFGSAAHPPRQATPAQLCQRGPE